MPWTHQFSNIPLSKIDQRELVNEPWQNNKGRPRADYEQLMEDSHEVNRMMNEMGCKREDFEELSTNPDPKLQRLAHSYHTLYEQGYGEAIRVEWSEQEGLYKVDNGRHRLEVAREKGLTHIPGYIIAPDEQTMSRLQAENNQSYQQAQSNNRYQPVWQHENTPTLSTTPVQQQNNAISPGENQYKPSWTHEQTVIEERNKREQRER